MNGTASALRGTLEDFSAPEILEFLAATGQTGALHFAGECEGVVWFVDGTVRFAESETNLPLRDALLRSGAAEEAAWTAAEAEHHATGEALPDALVRTGALDAAVLARAVHEQVVSAVFELLVLRESSFEFRPGERSELAGATTFPVAELVEEGRRRLEQWKVVASTIPSTGAVVALAPTLPAGATQVTLTSEEWRVVAALDGHRSVAEVTAMLGMSAFELCALLHQLILQGAVLVVA